MPESPEELFTQVIAAARADLLKLWEEGDRFIGKLPPACPNEIDFKDHVGRNYYQCQPHLWQCYWQGGVVENPSLKIDLFGQTYHVQARPVFDPIKQYSDKNRFYEMFKRKTPSVNLHYGYVIELGVREIPDLTQAMILSDTCRDVYLPERIYGYGQVRDKREEGFAWDNFGRKIFIDKFYVSNQQVNEWRLLTGETDKMLLERKSWPAPAVLNSKDQKSYCSFFGKRVLEAKLFDAATMPPSDLKNSMPDRVLRQQTPWHRDLSKTFLGMARINPDYQLTPLDCQLAQVQGCPFKLFTTDSTSWIGINYPLGFYPESFVNIIGPDQDLKLSSRFFPPGSEWHELGVRTSWKDDDQAKNLPVAFRCYEEVAQ
jgi:hypothetical protein